MRRLLLETIHRYQREVGSDTFIEDFQVAIYAGQDVNNIRHHLRFLATQDFLELQPYDVDSEYFRVRLAPAGRQAVETGDFSTRRDASAQTPHTVSFQINNSTVGNLVQGSGHQGNVYQRSTGSNLDDVPRLLEQMVSIVRQAPTLSTAEQNDYALDADALRAELQRSTPRPGRIQELLGTLSNAGGAVGLATTLAEPAKKLYELLAPFLLGGGS